MTNLNYKTVQDILEENTLLAFHDIATILLNTLTLLKGYHSNGHVYGYLTPANVLISQDDKFIVELRDQVEHNVLPADLSGLELKSLLGLSPEHFNSGAKIDHRSDFYSLGYIAYCLLSRKDNPYSAETASDLVNKIWEKPLPDPSSVNIITPEWMSSWFRS